MLQKKLRNMFNGCAMETEGSSTKQKLSNPLITLKTYSIRAINDLLEVSGALQNKSF